MKENKANLNLEKRRKFNVFLWDLKKNFSNTHKIFKIVCVKFFVFLKSILNNFKYYENHSKLLILKILKLFILLQIKY